MATLYPASSDVFNVPGSPSTTPLSSAGTGTRNHVTLHRDINDAVMALQDNAAQITHTHSGVGLNAPKLVQANTHESPDTDASAVALHHTLGTGQYQSAAGNHNHDTRYIRLDGSVNQTITGKKTFPSGSTAIAIPDFQNSVHSHWNNASGGPALINAAVARNTYLGTDVLGHVTQDMWLNYARFTIPPNQALIGDLNLCYMTSFHGPSVAGSTEVRDQIFWYVSWHQYPDSPAFDQNKNAMVNGASLNGTMFEEDHDYPIQVAQKRRNQLIPLYIPPVSYERPQIALVLRVFNNGGNYIRGLNWGLRVAFTTQQFFTI